jgi:hypothetical protein
MRIVYLLLCLLVMIQVASSMPSVTNVSMHSIVWIGETLNISLKCTDSSFGIDGVYANITGPGIILPGLQFSSNPNSTYTLSISSLYLDRTGVFNANLTCRNINNELASVLKQFTVSRLEGNITKILPTPVYSKDVVEIDFSLKVNGVNLESGPSFNVTLNGTNTPLKILPAYDTTRGWILKLDPLSTGKYDVEVSAFYDRANIKDTNALVVNEDLYFSIVSLATSNVRPGDNITAILKATEEGNDINLNTDNLEIRVGSDKAVITDIRKIDNTHYVSVIIPEINYGSYDFKAILKHKSSEYVKKEKIEYRMPLKGTIVDNSGRAITTRIKLFSGGSEKLNIQTDGKGFYSGNILPGTYNAEIIFPQSVLKLDNVKILDFDDSIKYNYIENPNIPGIRAAAVHVFKIGLDFTTARVEMGYNDKNIDENSLKIFRCLEWEGECKFGWEEALAEFDKGANTAKLTLSNLSAFAIGTKDRLETDYNLDKTVYNIKDIVKVRGVVWNSNKEEMSGVKLNVYGDDFPLNLTKISDSNGVFIFEFLTPETEGNYTFTLESDKHPFVSTSSKKTFEVTKKRDLSIITPSAMEVRQGEKRKFEISIINIGQTELSNITIAMENIPDYYIIKPDEIQALGINEKASVEVHFLAPLNASAFSGKGKITVYSNEVRKSREFGFSLLKAEEKEIPETTGFAVSIPAFGTSSYLAFFALLSFGAAYLLKKRKNVLNKKSIFDTKFSGTVVQRIHAPTNTYSQPAGDLKAIKEIVLSRKNSLKIKENSIKKNDLEEMLSAVEDHAERGDKR